jgi:tetratricopeptide (TPR) repeat protein
VFRYKGREIDVESLSLALNVRAVVTGRVVKHGDMLNIQAELVDAETESQLWGDQYRRSLSDMFSVQEDISWQISEALRVRLTGEQKRRLKKPRAPHPKAYEAYLRGRHHWNKWTGDGFRKAIECFDQAIEQDPAYALAYSGLGDTYGAMSYYGYLPPDVAMPRARAAALKALELDDSLAEPHTTIGLHHLFFERNWAAAGASFRRAIELNPRYPQAHLFYGVFLLSQGKQDEALAVARRAQELDPLSSLLQTGVAWILMFSRRYDEALRQLKQVLDLDPAFAEANSVLVNLYDDIGEHQKAARTLETMMSYFALRLTGASELTAALEEGGPPAYWRKRIELLQRLADTTYVIPYAFAALYARSGDTDRAFEWLDRMIDANGGQAVFLKVDPGLDRLRADPRFSDLLRRAGFDRL